MNLVKNILALIETARELKILTNDQARSASVNLELTGPESMAAGRLASGGADPASLQLFKYGEVDDLVALAHHAGPGVYKADDPERETYLALCALSMDESQGSTLRERVLHYVKVLQIMDNPEQMAALAAIELEKIMACPYMIRDVCGLDLRIYLSDLGFANAYWSGRNYAAVYFDVEEPYLYVCTNGERSISSLGITFDKVLDTNRALILKADRVKQIMED